MSPDNNMNHNSSNSAKIRSNSDKKALEEIMRDLGNLFLKDSSDLYNIHTKHTALLSVSKTVMKFQKYGDDQYKKYVQERQETASISIMDIIKQNKYALFGTALKQRSLGKTRDKIASLKNDCSLFSRLFIATSTNQSGDLNDFFLHENQAYPP